MYTNMEITTVNQTLKWRFGLQVCLLGALRSTLPLTTDIAPRPLFVRALAQAPRLALAPPRITTGTIARPDTSGGPRRAGLQAPRQGGRRSCAFPAHIKIGLAYEGAEVYNDIPARST